MGLIRSSANIFSRLYHNIGNSYRYVSKLEIERGYKKQPSFCDRLPYQEWLDSHDIVLLEDGKSVGLCIEVLDIPADCRPDSFLERLHENVTKAFSSAFPLEANDPWVMQLFSFDDYDFSRLYELVVDYVNEKNPLADPLSKPLVQANLELIKDHLDELTEPGGTFTDPLSDLPFRGKIRRHRICIYRRYSDTEPSTNVIEELMVAKDRFLNKLATVNIHAKQLSGQDFYEWMVKHFHRNPKVTNGSVSKLLSRFPYIPEDDRTHGYDFTQRLFHCEVESTELGWKFDDIYHKCWYGSKTTCFGIH